MENGNRRGFVTIATGSDSYYQLAAALLHSYRIKTESPIPFAIICDRENDFTKDFDCAVVMEAATGSYMDKLQLYRYTPYYETIFVDADALFLKNPEQLWRDFEGCRGVSCYGKTLEPNDKSGWFQQKNAGKFEKDISFSLNLHGGIYYFEKTELTRSVFELAIALSQEYEQYRFRDFVRPADEPLMAMSMAIHGLHPCEEGGRILFLPSYEGKLHANAAGQLFLKQQKADPIILHFATKNTRRFLYRFFTEVINREPEGIVPDMRCRKKRYRSLWLTCLPLEMKSLLRYCLKRTAKRLLPGSVIQKIRKKLR